MRPLHANREAEVERSGSERDPRRTEADIELEARRLLAATWDSGINARLLGGLAVAERVPAEIRSAFTRECGDIDIVIRRRASAGLITLMGTSGYVEDVELNAMNGRMRLVFSDPARRRDVDVFVEEFEMCHVVPLRLEEADRRGARTLLLADLLLTKLQIVKLTEKDVVDIVMLLMAYDVEGDDERAIDGSWIAAQCAGNWGLWRTTTENIDRVRTALQGLVAPAELLARARDRLDSLAEQLEQQPKSTKWRMRARVGDRVRWYEEPDEK